MSPRQLRAFVMGLLTRERHLLATGKKSEANLLKEVREALVEALETGDDDTDLKGRKRK